MQLMIAQTSCLPRSICSASLPSGEVSSSQFRILYKFSTHSSPVFWSFMKTLKRTVLKMEFWRTPLLTGHQLDVTPFTTTLWVQPVSQLFLFAHFITYFSSYMLDILSWILLWETVLRDILSWRLLWETVLRALLKFFFFLVFSLSFSFSLSLSLFFFFPKCFALISNQMQEWIWFKVFMISRIDNLSFLAAVRNISQSASCVCKLLPAGDSSQFAMGRTGLWQASLQYGNIVM